MEVIEIQNLQKNVLSPQKCFACILYISYIQSSFRYSSHHLLRVIRPHFMLAINDIMSEHASLVSARAVQNRLTLNVDKTKAIVIGSYFYSNQLPATEVKGVSFGQTLIKFKKICLKS